MGALAKLLGQPGEAPMELAPDAPLQMKPGALPTDGGPIEGIAGMGRQGVPRAGTMPVGRGIAAGIPPGAEQMLMKQAIDDLLATETPDAEVQQIAGTIGRGGLGGKIGRVR